MVKRWQDLYLEFAACIMHLMRRIVFSIWTYALSNATLRNAISYKNQIWFTQPCLKIDSEHLKQNLYLHSPHVPYIVWIVSYFPYGTMQLQTKTDVVLACFSVVDLAYSYTRKISSRAVYGPDDRGSIVDGICKIPPPKLNHQYLILINLVISNALFQIAFKWPTPN